MTDEVFLEQLKKINRNQVFSNFFLGALVALLLLSFGLILLMIAPLQKAARLSVEANPVNTNENTVTVADPLDSIEARAERQGYFTKAQFAELMGVGIKTLERKIKAGLVEPPPEKTATGHVKISLDATMTRQ